MKTKYPNIIAELARNGIKKTELSKMLGITYECLRNKLNGTYEWKISEIFQIMKITNKDFEYLFMN